MSIPSANPNAAFDPRLALRAFQKRKRLAAAVFLTVSLMALMATLRIKPVYESEASLFVRLGRESAGLDPTATTSEITPIYETREQELNSALEVMQSRKLLEAVIGVIGEDVILDPTKFSFDAWQLALQNTEWPELNPDIIHRSNAQHEMAVEKVYRAVALEVGRSSSVIGVTSVAATPELAQAITKTLLEAVQAEQIRLNQTHGLKFFSEQVAMLQDKLDTIRRKLTARKNELGLMSIASEQARLEDVATAMDKELNILVPTLAGARASEQVMAHEVKVLPDRSQPNDASDMLRKKMHELELKRATLLTKFTPQHLRVQDISEELAMVTQQLADPKNRNAANPTLRELEVLLANDRTKIAQTEAEIREYRQEREELSARLQHLNEVETELQSMTDRADETKAALLKATVKLEQARVLDQLSKEQISNIQVVQPATFNPVSTSAPRSMVLVSGLIIGCIAACVVPAIVEFAAWYLQTLRPENNSHPNGSTAEGLVS